MLYALLLPFSSFCICSALYTNVPYDAVKITLHVFSGTRDPEWKFVKGESNYTTAVSLVQDIQDTPLASRLGYSGYSVDLIIGTQTTTKTIGMCHNRSLETALLNLIKGLAPIGETQPLTNNVINYVEETLMKCQ